MSHFGSHIVLVGFMGSGKSTIGSMVAKNLNFDFIDLDSYIIDKEQMSIAQIFEQHGEVYFRSIETKYLMEVLEKETQVVLATGGGAPCFNDSMNLIKDYSISFYLKVGRAELAKRLKNDSERPLIQNKTEKELSTYIRDTLRHRAQFYEQANYTIRGRDSAKSIVKRLTKSIQSKIK